jgi:2OG-Fe(II) oxygenase superfamily
MGARRPPPDPDARRHATRLKEVSTQKRDEFLNAKPFPHVVIDEFVDPEILGRVANEFPGPDDPAWQLWGPGPAKQSYDRRIEKLGLSAEEGFGTLTRHLMHVLNSRPVIEFIENLTGSAGIFPDPSFNACGLHSTGPGGRLMIHIDQNRWPVRGQMHQRFNLILFLNRDWKEEYGGHLELWNGDATQCVKKILPVFNRMVLFDTGRYSYHGHPEPLNCPPQVRRNSLAVYYYVIDRPVDANYLGMQSIQWVPTARADRYGVFVRRVTFVASRVTPPFIWDWMRGFLRNN